MDHLQLYQKQYSEEELINNIANLDLIMILNTQVLSASFCINYILNKTYQTTQEEKHIDIFLVLNKQEHLSLNDIINVTN